MIKSFREWLNENELNTLNEGKLTKKDKAYLLKIGNTEEDIPWIEDAIANPKYIEVTLENERTNKSKKISHATAIKLRKRQEKMTIHDLG